MTDKESPFRFSFPAYKMYDKIPSIAAKSHLKNVSYLLFIVLITHFFILKCQRIHFSHSALQSIVAV